ncbi:MAG: hypothetical protein WA642_23430, partial [Steroidobacteraceae bacterium]
MSEFKGIPILQPQRTPRSGDKYTTAQGFTAIKDGVKVPAAGHGAAGHGAVPALRTAQRLPPW